MLDKYNLSCHCELILSKTNQRIPFKFHEMAFDDSRHQRLHIISIEVDFENIEGSGTERMYK